MRRRQRLADIPESGFAAKMAVPPTDLSQSLEQLLGLDAGCPRDAPTLMVAEIVRSCKKPLRELTDDEIGSLVVQHYGYPHVLDLVWPTLESNPLFDGGYYPGDVLSNLIRAKPEVWADRPDYKAELMALYKQALARSPHENEAFRESLGLPASHSAFN